MPPDATVDIRWPATRNGLAMLLAAVVGAGEVTSVGGVHDRVPHPAEAGSRARSSWRPSLRPISDAEGREPGVITLMRGERLRLASLSAEDLLLLDGIGPQRARILIEARRDKVLASLADVDRLPGFGSQLVSRLASAVEFADGGEE